MRPESAQLNNALKEMEAARLEYLKQRDANLKQLDEIIKLIPEEQRKPFQVMAARGRKAMEKGDTKTLQKLIDDMPKLMKDVSGNK